MIRTECLILVSIFKFKLNLKTKLNSTILGLYNFDLKTRWPITITTQPQTCSVLYRSNVWLVSLNPTSSTHVGLHSLCFVFSYVRRGLATGRSPTEEPS